MQFMLRTKKLEAAAAAAVKINRQFKMGSSTM